MNEDPKAKPTTVLVVEDEIQIRRLLRVVLERDGYRVVEAGSGEEGIGEAARCQPDAVLLDLGLPDLDGQQVLKRLREWSEAPILVVTVREHEDEKIMALDNGANDYVTKPFGTGELLARLRASLRLARPVPSSNIFRSGHLQADLASRTVKANGKVVKLTATEYALLQLFIRHAGKVLTHRQILREVWGPENVNQTGYLRVYIAYLREKLETNPSEPELFLTEPGVGYRLAARD